MLRVENLSKSFGKNKVLHNINFEIKEGEIVVVIGPSGCGKSTLLRCINYIEEPTHGKIFLDNIEITKKTIHLLRENSGMVFQSFNLFSNLTVIDNIILSPILNKKMDRITAIKKAKEYLNNFDLLDKINAMPNNLSGGEKQRIAIIRQLILNPKLILFDEPTSALDPNKKQESVDIIKNLSKNNITSLIVSHDIEFIKNVATRIIFIADGKIILDDEPEKILKSDNTYLKKFLNEIE